MSLCLNNTIDITAPLFFPLVFGKIPPKRNFSPFCVNPPAHVPLCHMEALKSLSKPHLPLSISKTPPWLYLEMQGHSVNKGISFKHDWSTWLKFTNHARDSNLFLDESQIIHLWRERLKGGASTLPLTMNNWSTPMAYHILPTPGLAWSN